MARVLYIHTQALRADSPHARATFQMLHLLRRAGLEVDVLTLPGGDPWPQGLATRLFRTLHVPFARTLPPYGTGLRRRWATAVMALAAARLLLTNHYDAVHCADRSVRLGVLLAWLFGVRLVFEWRVASGYDLASWARPRGRRRCGGKENEERHGGAEHPFHKHNYIFFLRRESCRNTGKKENDGEF